MLRKHMAKMVSQYALNVLGTKPNPNIQQCTSRRWIDAQEESAEMKKFMELACNLRYMFLEFDGQPNTHHAYPNAFVDFAQTWTIFSRIVFGDKYNGNDDPWYAWHRDGLYRQSIITKTDKPFDRMLRSWFFLMMLRTATKTIQKNWDGITPANAQEISDILNEVATESVQGGYQAEELYQKL